MTKEASKSFPVWAGYGLAVVSCAFFAFVAAREVWPPMDGDGAMLFPSAVELARGNGFVNTPWIPPLNDTIDGPGGRRHISHGFLNQLLIGLAASFTGSDAPQCVAWSYVVLLFAASVCGAAVLGSRRENPSSALLLFILGFLSVSGSFALAFAWFGRMEAMVMLWVGCAMLCLRRLPPSAGYLACGGFLGFMAWTSPVSAIVGVVILAVYTAAKVQLSVLHGMSLAATGSLVATFLSLSIYPYTLPEWIEGTIRHSQIHFDHPAFQGLMHTWVMRSHVPLLAVTAGVLIAFALAAVFQTSRTLVWWRKAFIGVGCVLLVAALFRLSVVRAEAAYNLVPFVPVLAATALHARQRFAGIAVLIALLLPTVGLARSSILLASQVANGPRYSEVRALVSEKSSDGVLVSKGLWLAVSDLARVSYGRPESGRMSPQWFIDQQVATGRGLPADYAGYRLVTNRFGGPVRLFGLPINRAPTGWQYALYEKVTPGD